MLGQPIRRILGLDPRRDFQSPCSLAKAGVVQQARKIVAHLVEHRERTAARKRAKGVTFGKETARERRGVHTTFYSGDLRPDSDKVRLMKTYILVAVFLGSSFMTAADAQ